MLCWCGIEVYLLLLLNFLVGHSDSTLNRVYYTTDCKVQVRILVELVFVGCYPSGHLLSISPRFDLCQVYTKYSLVYFILWCYCLFDQGPFRCEKCDKIFPKWGQYNRHMKGHEEDKPYCCTKCPATYNIEDNLKLHMALHQTGSPQCPDCGKKFSRIASLKAHIMLHEKEESLICPECGDEFALQVGLLSLSLSLSLSVCVWNMCW